MKIIKWDKIDFRGRVENVCDKKTDMEKKIRADPTTLFYPDKKCICTEFKDKSENNLKWKNKSISYLLL